MVFTNSFNNCTHIAQYTQSGYEELLNQDSFFAKKEYNYLLAIDKIHKNVL